MWLLSSVIIKSSNWKPPKDDENLEGYNALTNGSLTAQEEETVENTVDEIDMEIDSERNSSAHGSMLDQICPTEVENYLNNKTLGETNIGGDIYTNQGENDFDSHESENDLKVEHLKFCNENDNLGNASKFEPGHVKSVHLKIGLLTCQYCDKSFVTNQSVKMHIDAIHFQLRPFSCDFCEETFTQKSNLKTHVKNKH